MQDANNGYLIVLNPWNNAGHISLIKKTHGNEVALAAYTGRVLSSAKITVTARGP